MANDFRAQQARVSKIIGSGSSIMVYPSGSASDFAGNVTFSSGSVGTDVFLFISGSSTAKTLFGGDTHTSGAVTVGGAFTANGATSLNGTVGLGDAAADVVTVTGQLTASQGLSASLPVIGGTARFNFLSGTLQKTAAGANFLVGNNLTVNYNSSGQWELSGSAAASVAFLSGAIAYSGSSGITGSSALGFNDNTKTLTLGGPLSASLVDAITSNSSSVATFTHNAGTGSAGIGADITFRVSNGSGVLTDAAAIGGMLLTTTNGAESGSFDIKTRAAGGALRRVMRVYGSGGMSIGTEAVTVTDAGNGTITLPTIGGIYVNSGGTLYTIAGVFGGSTLIYGSGAYNVQLNAYSLSISAGQGMGLNNGWLTIAAAAGFRRVKSDVNNTNKTGAVTENMINMISMSAPRTVTLPAATDGVIYRVNGNQFASPTNYIAITGSSNAKINGRRDMPVYLTQPYSSVELWSDGEGWQVHNTTPRTTNESHIDFAIARNAAGAVETAGDYSYGINFSVATGSLCVGFRLLWSGSTPRDFMVKLWSGSVAIASQSVALTGSNDYRGVWTTPVVMTRYNNYYMSFRETTGTYYYPTTVTDIADFGGGSGMTPVRFGQNNVLIGKFFNNVGAGDTFPSSESFGSKMATIEPTVVF
jgi:hypothetical protein